MLTIKDSSILIDFEEAERKAPCPRKVVKKWTNNLGRFGAPGHQARDYPNGYRQR
jgi:hypothetical protein